LRVVGWGLRVEGCGLRAVDCRLRVRALGFHASFKNMQPTTHNPQSTTRNPQPSTTIPSHEVRAPGFHASFENMQPATRNPQPAALNHHPQPRSPVRPLAPAARRALGLARWGLRAAYRALGLEVGTQPPTPDTQHASLVGTPRARSDRRPPHGARATAFRVFNPTREGPGPAKININP
jgi:hypothetical protein